MPKSKKIDGQEAVRGDDVKKVGEILARQGSMTDLDGFLATNDAFYGPGAVMGTFIGNHDLPRPVLAYCRSGARCTSSTRSASACRPSGLPRRLTRA